MLRRMPAPDLPRTLRLAIVPVVLLIGCGGEATTSKATKTRAPSPRPTTTMGADLAPLPSELIGSWEGDAGGDTVFRTTYYAAGSDTCERLSEPGVGCYTVRSVSGSGAESKEVFEWGPAGLKDGNLVTIALVAGKPGCEGNRTVWSYTVEGDELVLVSVGGNCLGDRDGHTVREERAPGP